MVIMDEDRAEDAEQGQEPGREQDQERARLPMLLEAVLAVGTDLELRATLQHLVDSATELVGARCGALGVVDPER
ncbi:histidine kinase, partial [Streptomyces sp. NPDC059202]